MAPPNRTEAIDNMFTTTWRNVKKKVVDQAFEITPFFSTLLEGNRIKEVQTGGRYIDVPVQYAKANQNAKWFDGSDEFGVDTKQFLTQITFKMKYLGDTIVRRWVDDQQNRGPAKMLDYVNQKIENHKASLVDKLEDAVWSSDPSGKGITPITTLIATDPTSGTVGNLDRATYTWLRNNTATFSGSIDTDLIPTMRTMVNDCSKQNAGMRRSPDLIMTTQTIYEGIEEIAEGMQQIIAANSPKASLGFGALSYKGIPMVWAPGCPAGNMYFLNTEHIKFMIDKFAYFDMQQWKTRERNEDRLAHILTCCELTCDNFQKQGVISSIA